MKKVNLINISSGVVLTALVLLLIFAIYQLVSLNWFQNAGFVTIVITLAMIVITAAIIYNTIISFIKHLKETKK